MFEKKKLGTIKESTVNALDMDAGTASNAGVGVSIPKDIWEQFIVEVRARNLKVHIEADGPQITKIEVHG